MQRTKTIASKLAGTGRARIQGANKAESRRQQKTRRISEKHEIFDGRVVIFRTKAHSGDVYQVRIYVQDEGRHVRLSLRTRDLQIAKDRAEEKFFELQGRIRAGEKIFSISAAELQERFLNQQNERVLAGQLSQSRFNNIRTFTNHYLDFVGKQTKICNIDQRRFEGYLRFRQQKKRDIKSEVVLNEATTIKMMYRFAVKQGLIQRDYECDFGEIRVDKDKLRRDAISVEDYKALRSVARLWYTKAHEGYTDEEEEIYYRKTIRDFIALQANFGFRTGELVSLVWRDVKIHQDGTASVTIQGAKTKVRKTRTVTGRRGDVFVRRQEYGRFTGADDFVFSHYRQNKRITNFILYNYFNSLKKDVKKQYESFNEDVDLYSLRHFWITCWLSTGQINAYQLARYAGTSLQQIQKTYDHMEDSAASKSILSVNWRFDKNNQIVLDDD